MVYFSLHAFLSTHGTPGKAIFLAMVRHQMKVSWGILSFPLWGFILAVDPLIEREKPSRSLGIPNVVVFVLDDPASAGWGPQASLGQGVPAHFVRKSALKHLLVANWR